MCVCVGVCMCVCVCVCVCGCVHVLCVCVYGCVHVWVCVWVCACVCACVCGCVHVCAWVCACVCVGVCMCACWVCACVRVWVCGCVHVCVRVCSVCFFLSPVALFLVCFYSLTKRFTDFTHVYLGAALALSPLGAWLAVEGWLSLPPVVLALGVVFWLIGFDIIYAAQDYEFDRDHGLRSLIVRWGIKNALQAAFLAHLIMWGLLVAFGFLLRVRFDLLGFAYFAGMALILVCLLLEHWLARKRSLKWIHFAFFRLNALISVIFLVATVVEVSFPMFRVRV